MKKTESYNKLILPITFILVILLIVNYFSANDFRQGAENYSAPALEGTNGISGEEIAELQKGTVIRIGESEIPGALDKLDIVSLLASDLLSKSSIRSIRKANAPRILIADTPNIEARAWILLSQRGIKEIFISQEKLEGMALKYEFRPDTISVSE